MDADTLRKKLILMYGGLTVKNDDIDYILTTLKSETPIPQATLQKIYDDFMNTAKAIQEKNKAKELDNLHHSRQILENLAIQEAAEKAQEEADIDNLLQDI